MWRAEGGDTDSECTEWTKDVEAVSAKVGCGAESWVTNQEGKR
jgi:hypothetical protein